MGIERGGVIASFHGKCLQCIEATCVRIVHDKNLGMAEFAQAGRAAAQVINIPIPIRCGELLLVPSNRCEARDVVTCSVLRRGLSATALLSIRCLPVRLQTPERAAARVRGLKLIDVFDVHALRLTRRPAWRSNVGCSV